MELYVADAFADEPFAGNPAGVALLAAGEPYPPDGWMRKLAGELKHSETAFVRPVSPAAFEARYFTPADEVDLCGHATVALFTVLRERAGLPAGRYTLHTRAGRLRVDVAPDCVWMDLAPPREHAVFGGRRAGALYRAFGLEPSDCAAGLPPQVVGAGLRDILLPVRDADALNRAALDAGALCGFSRRCGVVGAHLFCLCGEGPYLARCRNFAPLYGIDEESATGTSNVALTYYLYRRGLARPGAENRFLQGETLGRPSVIRTLLDDGGGSVSVRVGGNAAVTLQCALQPGSMPR